AGEGPAGVASPAGPSTRAASRRGALLWEVDPARLGPALQELSLLNTWRAVGESPDLYRPVLTVQLDRQKPLGIACGAAAQRPDRRVPCNALCRVARDAVVHGPRLRHQIAGCTQLDHQILLALGAILGRRAPRPVCDRSTRPAAAAGHLACQRLSTRTGVRRLRAAACGLDTLDRFEVAVPLAHLPAQRSERA